VRVFVYIHEQLTQSQLTSATGK